jgi:hypothetical protein
MASNSSELKVSVQLPELGKVEVRAVTTHDVTTAHLTAFRHDALPVLTADRTALEQTLKSHDVILGSLDARAQGQSASQQRQQNLPSDAKSAAATPPVRNNGAGALVAVEESVSDSLPDYLSLSVRA